MRQSPIALAEEAVRAIAIDPRTAFDQLMVILPANMARTAYHLEIYNTDGSRSGACGNGTRCVADFLQSTDPFDQIVLSTATSLLTVWNTGDGIYTVDMGKPKFDWQDIPLAEPFHDTKAIELQIGPIDDPVLHSPATVNMGNPHAIFWVEDAASYDLAGLGPLLENHPIFPERANISLAQVMPNNEIVLRVWERGAGLTLACGSAACAAAVAANRTGRAGRQSRVHLPGGELMIDWRDDDHVLMTGGTTYEHGGQITLDADQVPEIEISDQPTAASQ
jgi:diaminopimelate epimerase